MRDTTSASTTRTPAARRSLPRWTLNAAELVTWLQLIVSLDGTDRGEPVAHGISVAGSPWRRRRSLSSSPAKLVRPSCGVQHPAEARYCTACHMLLRAGCR